MTLVDEPNTGRADAARGAIPPVGARASAATPAARRVGARPAVSSMVLVGAIAMRRGFWPARDAARRDNVPPPERVTEKDFDRKRSFGRLLSSRAGCVLTIE